MEKLFTSFLLLNSGGGKQSFLSNLTKREKKNLRIATFLGNSRWKLSHAFSDSWLCVHVATDFMTFYWHHIAIIISDISKGKRKIIVNKVNMLSRHRFSHIINCDRFSNVGFCFVIFSAAKSGTKRWIIDADRVGVNVAAFSWKFLRLKDKL